MISNSSTLRRIPSGATTLLAAVFLMVGCADADPSSPAAPAEPAFNQGGAELGVVTQTTNVMDQEDVDTGDREVFAEDAATLRRTPNGFTAQISMPTPVKGEYRYPEADSEVLEEQDTAADLGEPQTFTLWAFVFDPDQDPFNPDAGQLWSGAFAVAGHAVGGPNLTLSGHISKNTEPVAGEFLENPDVEVHLAVAPHGGLDPDIMPEQIKTPAFGPPMWWVAIFEAVSSEGDR